MSDPVGNPEDRVSHDEAHMSLEETCLWSDTHWAVEPQKEPQKMARGLKYQTWEVLGVYYLCSEKKVADQLHGYPAADLCLCFRICKKQVFS